MSVQPAIGRCFAALALLAAGGCAASADDAPDGGADAGAPAACIGAIPADAWPCPGSAAGLASDAARVVVASCVCASPCSVVACSYACDTGYVLGDGGCEAEVVTPPAVQVVDNGDGTVTVEDGFGRLVWLQDASCAETAGGVAGGLVSWWQANAWSAALAAGACGLRDGSAPGGWRLPEPSELTHLMTDLGAASPVRNTQSGPFWSSFCHHDYCSVVQGGRVDEYPAPSLFAVWPVRR